MIECEGRTAEYLPRYRQNDRGPKLPITVGFSCVSKTFTIWQTVLTFSASESKNYTAFDRFHGNSRSVWQNPYQERTNQNVRIYLKTNTLPCIIINIIKHKLNSKKLQTYFKSIAYEINTLLTFTQNIRKEKLFLFQK